MKEKIAAVVGSLTCNPALSSFGRDILIEDQHTPYDGVSFFRRDLAAGEVEFDCYGRVDFFFNTDDGDSRGRWMLFGMGPDGETLFVIADIDPAMVDFVVVPVICKFLTTPKIAKVPILDLLKQVVQFAESNRECYIDGTASEVAWRKVRDALKNIPEMIELLYRVADDEIVVPDSPLREDISLLLHDLSQLAPASRK